MNPERIRTRDGRTAFLYLAPAGLLLLVFYFIPIFISFVVSLTNWEGADTVDLVSFVGLRNYERTLRDDEFHLVLMNTMNYALWSVPLTLVFGLGAALLLQRGLAGRSFFRTAFFLPHVTTWVAVSIVWRYFFDIQYGPLNAILTRWLGIEPLRWLQEPRGVIQMAAGALFDIEKWPEWSVLGEILAGPSLAMVSIITTSVWRDLGFFMIIFLAGLSNIDPACYEAARIDGSTAWQRFRFITLPLLTPTTFFLVLIATISAFRVFVPILVMTPGGGPAKATSTLVYYMYEKGFVQWRLGLAASVAYILFMILLLLALLQNRLLGRRVHYGQ